MKVKIIVRYFCPLIAACAFLISSVAGAQTISVSSANPPAAAQGTVNLNVTLGGKGFKAGARAAFIVTGTPGDPGGITVNSTTYVNATQLVANITVSDTATVSNFDVVVSNTDGRTGKGNELFAVSAKTASGNCTGFQAVPAGITLLGTVNPKGVYANNVGQSVQARLVTLGGRTVVVAAAGSNGTVHFFFLDAGTGQLLDGTNIGSATAVQPHIALGIVRPDGTAGGARTMAAGDVNGDGIPDFAVGSGASNGAVNVYVGSVVDGILSYTPYLVMPNAGETYLGYGYAVAFGDVDGDPANPGDELVAGAFGGASGRKTIPGKVYVFHFNVVPRAFTQVQAIADPQANSGSGNGFGRAVAVADVRGDSHMDLIAGSPFSSTVWVFDHFQTPGISIAGTDGYGWKVSAGNINGDAYPGDAYPDVLVATECESSTCPRTHADILYGLLTPGQTAAGSLTPDSGYDSTWATAKPDLSDLNGDALDEAIIGAPSATCGGVAYLWGSAPGAPIGTAGSTKYSLRTPVPELHTFGFGTALVPHTRLFLVSDQTQTVNGVTNAGQVYVYGLN